jgi:hypothetical protein
MSRFPYRSAQPRLRNPATLHALAWAVFSVTSGTIGFMVTVARTRRSRVTVYDAAHAAARVLAVARYRPGDACAIGGERLTVPAAYLDLAHDHVNGGYLGLACRRHNRGEGASRGNRMRGPLPRAQRKAIAFKVGRWR